MTPFLEAVLVMGCFLAAADFLWGEKTSQSNNKAFRKLLGLAFFMLGVTVIGATVWLLARGGARLGRLRRSRR